MAFASYPSLRDRVVAVTGGASGIGADLVRAFAGQGAKVAFLDIQDAPAAALCEELGTPRYFHCDLTDIPALRATLAEIAASLGAVSVLVNNAGNDRRQRVDEVTPEDWDLSQAINLRPQFFAAQAVIPGMRGLGGGSIINLSSVAWRAGGADMAPYVTAKAAIIGLTRALARAVGRDAIRVNAIEPGAVMTERQRRLWYKTDASVEAMVDRQSIPRVLHGEDVARMALFLAADDSRMITKQTFTVDAGLR